MEPKVTSMLAAARLEAADSSPPALKPEEGWESSELESSEPSPGEGGAGLSSPPEGGDGWEGSVGLLSADEEVFLGLLPEGV